MIPLPPSAASAQPSTLHPPAGPGVPGLLAAVGAFCAALGVLILLAPHQLSSPLYAALQPLLPLWGVGFLLAGVALLAAAASTLPPRLAVAGQALAAAMLLLLAAGFARTGTWSGMTNYGALAAAVALAPLGGAGRGGLLGRLLADPLVPTLGLGGALTGGVLLATLDQYQVPLFDAVRHLMPVFGALLALGGAALLAAWLLAAARPAPLRVVALGTGLVWVAFAALVSVPLRAWTGVIFYGGFGVTLVAIGLAAGRHARPDPRSLRTRFALALGAASAVPLLVFAVENAQSQERWALAEILAHQQALAVGLADDVASYVALHRAAVDLLAAHPGLAALDPPALAALLAGYRRAYPEMAHVAVTDGEGRLLAVDPPELAAAGQRPTLPQAAVVLQSGARALLVEVSPLLGRPVLAIGAPVRDADGRVVAVAAAAQDITRLAGTLGRAAAGGPGQAAAVVDARGRALVSSDPRAATPLGADLAATPGVAALLAGRAAGSLDAGGRLAGFARVPESDLGVVAERPTALALDPVRARRELTFALVVLAVGLAAAAGWLAAGFLVHPLTAFVQAAQRLSTSDEAGRLPRTEITELRSLANAFAASGARLALRTAERDRAEASLRALNADLELRITQRTADLQATVTELEAFAYSVSHDLRAPLRGIDGFSLALLEDYSDRLDAEGQDYLHRVRAGTQRMGSLIDDLLTLSRLTRTELRSAQVDLSRLAEAVVADLRRDSPERSVEVRVTPGLVAHGDPGLLRSLLENLLANAWKFTRPRELARVQVGAVVTPDGPAFYVRDNGVGFDMAHADRLFGAFQRLHSIRDFEGTGIGLATVQRIARRHGGRAWAEGAVGRGATFWFSLAATSGASLPMLPLEVHA